jgi:sulfate adenylyltransferase
MLPPALARTKKAKSFQDPMKVIRPDLVQINRRQTNHKERAIMPSKLSSKTENSTDSPPELVSPYGGSLVNLLAEPDVLHELTAYAASLPSLQLSDRSVCDLELLATGAFSPLDRFMGKTDYETVLTDMRLASGHVFPIPLTLPLNHGAEIELDHDVALRDSKNELLAVMTVEEIFAWDLKEAADRVFGTQDSRHPLVAEMHRWGKLNISGKLRMIKLPVNHDFQDLRLTPAKTREVLAALGHKNVIAFQTRNPLHRAHEELTKRAVEEKHGVLLLHPVVGMTKPGDVDHYTRVRTYRAMAAGYYDPRRIILSLLPLAMRLAGPREAVWHAVIRRNYGANYIIIGRDHASPGLDSKGQPFYDPYAGQNLVTQFSEAIGVGVIPFGELVYLPEEDRYEEATKLPANASFLALSGSYVREQYLSRGKMLPAWFTRPEVAEILAQTFPPRHRQGVCIWFTGLSGAGKSTTAEILTVLMLERGRRVTLLDGDVVRTHLSQGLGFSKEDRDINIRRIGFVAAEIVRHGGTVICAAVSPYRATRSDVRNLVGADNFVEVFVDTPLEICEQRDPKGMYAKARRGEISNFTGINDAYEVPENPEIILDGVKATPQDNTQVIIRHLLKEGFVQEEGSTTLE